MKSAYGFSTEGTLSFDTDVINSMGVRPSQKSLTRNKLLSKTYFQYSQGWYINDVIL